MNTHPSIPPPPSPSSSPSRIHQSVSLISLPQTLNRTIQTHPHTSSSLNHLKFQQCMRYSACNNNAQHDHENGSNITKSPANKIQQPLLVRTPLKSPFLLRDVGSRVETSGHNPSTSATDLGPQNRPPSPSKLLPPRMVLCPQTKDIIPSLSLILTWKLKALEVEFTSFKENCEELGSKVALADERWRGVRRREESVEKERLENGEIENCARVIKRLPLSTKDEDE